MDKEKQAYEWFSSISPVKVDWLWYPYIPCGKISILQGDPGCGKSMMIIDIISRLTTGRTLPDGRKIEPINVIYQCSEDGLQDTIKPRLERAGANCDMYKGRVGRTYSEYIALEQVSMFENLDDYGDSEGAPVTGGSGGNHTGVIVAAETKTESVEVVPASPEVT